MMSRSDAAPSGLCLQNELWHENDVRNHYSYGNSHSDLYRYLGQWSDLLTYLNVGYSLPNERHWSKKSHMRLVDRVATRLLAIHASGRFESPPHMLDIASGRGGPAIRAHKRYGLKVRGIDLTDFNVLRASRNSAEAKCSDQVTFEKGDATDLKNINDASFSLAWSIESPAHFKDKPRFLKAAARVLKRGGAFALADLLVVDRVATRSEHNRRVAQDFMQAWDVPNLMTLDGYRAALGEAGFELCDLEIATSRNLDYFTNYCRIFGVLFETPPLFGTYKAYLRRRVGVDLDNVYDHVVKSYRALRLGMIDYGIFWARKR